MKKVRLQAWLNHLCAMLPEVKQAVLITDFSSDATPSAIWPDENCNCTDLITIASLAARQNKTVTTLVNNSNEKTTASATLIAHPIHANKQQFGAVAILIDISQTQQPVIHQLLKWGESWFQLMLQPENNSDLSLINKAFEAWFSHQSLIASATAVASSLAQDLECERISVGLIGNKGVDIIAMSFSSNIDVKAPLMRSQTVIMNKAFHQKQTTLFPSEENTEEHGAYSPPPLHTASCAVLLLNLDEPVGVILFERPKGQQFEPGVITFFEQLGKLLGPLLASRQRENRTLRKKFSDYLSKPRGTAFGHHLSGYRLASAILIAAIIILSISSGTYRVTSPATIEGRIQQIVVAPFEGYINKAFSRAGQTIQAGDIIAELDTNSIELEQKRLANKKDEFTKQYRKALASLNQADAHIYKSQVEQAAAQLHLIKQKLQRAKLLSPLNGIIIAGDLSRSLGAPVEKGQVLFEVAPLDEYRLVLQISEQEIAEIKQGQTGYLTLNALPYEEISFQITQISPIFTETQGTITYRVEAAFEGELTALRPGMQGIAKITIGQRSYPWIFFHKLLDAIQLWIWSWLP